MLDDLRKKYGGFVSFRTDSAPLHEQTYGEAPDADFERLLLAHMTPESRVVDLGCGAGQVTCAFARNAGHIWGIELFEDLVAGARQFAAAAGVNNVTFLRGDVHDENVLAQLPDELDIVYSRRGPNAGAEHIRRLKVGGVLVQMLVAQFDGYPLKEIFGRRAFSPDHFGNDSLPVMYAGFGLQPISIKTYYYDSYFRDIDHLEAFLIAIPAVLRDWRLPDSPYDRARDRQALELYGQYHTTPDGIRVMRHRTLFAFRKVDLAYPVDSRKISPSSTTSISG